jgi:hypothetical protein
LLFLQPLLLTASIKAAVMMNLRYFFMIKKF